MSKTKFLKTFKNQLFLPIYHEIYDEVQCNTKTSRKFKTFKNQLLFKNQLFEPIYHEIYDEIQCNTKTSRKFKTFKNQLF